MSDKTFTRIDVHRAAEALSRLHEQVVTERIRVEMQGTGSNEVSVIISKEELDSLEKALAILSDSSAVQQLSQMLYRVATAAAALPVSPPTLELVQAT